MTPFNSKIRIFCDNSFVSSARDATEGIDNDPKLETNDDSTSESFALAKIEATSISLALFSVVLSPFTTFWLKYWNIY